MRDADSPEKLGYFAERGGIEPHPRKWTSRLAGGTNHRHSSLSVIAQVVEIESTRHWFWRPTGYLSLTCIKL